MAKTPEPEEALDAAKRAVVTVGAGRGFIIEAALGRFPVRLIVTAAHCLPRLPPALATAHAEERTYPGLLAPLGKRRAKVWAECVFADPVADIAVLATPDGQVHYDEAAAYDELAEGAPALPITDAPQEGAGWLLSLDGKWGACVVKHFGGPLWISDAAEFIVGGMSGSPILNSGGAAIGVVCCSSGLSGEPLNQHTEGAPNPKLMDSLPGRLLRGLAR